MAEVPTELSAKLSLLTLIEATAKFNRQIEALKHWPHFTGPVREQFEEWSSESTDSINDGLRQLGGFALSIEVPVPQTLILTRWKGEDPKNPSKHTWVAQGPWSYGDLPIDPENYKQIRRNLMSDSAD